MLCGFFENDITPPLGSNLPGYFVIRPADGVRTPLYARAMAVTGANGQDFILVSLDAITTDDEMTRLVRARVEEATGLPGERVMLAATHTHTGGPVNEFIPGSRDKEYISFLCRRAADAAVMAYARRVPAKIGFGACEERTISFIRRYRMKDGSFMTNPGWGRDDIAAPAGEIDPLVSVMRIDDMDGNLLGVVTNFACHLDTVGGNAICADYPSEIHRVIKRVYGEHVASIFLTGACGNINHFDFMHRAHAYYTDARPAHYVRMGRILAGDVIRALSTIESGDADVNVKTNCFRAQIRVPKETDVRAARALLAEKPYAPEVSHGLGGYEGSMELRARYFAHALLAVADIKEKSVDVDIQAVRIGDALLIGLPCELFVEFGLDMRALSPNAPMFLSTLTNGRLGYVSTREAFDQGGYEVQIADDTMMERETGYQMVEAVKALVQRL